MSSCRTDTSLIAALQAHRPLEDTDAVFVDEAQFLTPAQVDEAFEVAVTHGVPVLCYGLRGDFMTHSFPGSLRLLEIAHSIEELKTICRCGAKAVFNARVIDGEFVSHGEQVAIDGQQASYESLCGRCYLDQGRTRPARLTEGQQRGAIACARCNTPGCPGVSPSG